MGRPKMALPWPEDGTVLGHVVRVFLEAGASPVIVVTGEDAQEVGKAAEGWDVRRVPNPAFREGGMRSSIQAGLRALDPESQAALITPGDMPLIQPETVRSLIEAGRESDRRLIAPGLHGRRGHPILADRGEWEPILSLAPPQTMREYLRARTESIHRVEVDDPGVRVLRKPWCGVLLHRRFSTLSRRPLRPGTVRGLRRGDGIGVVSTPAPATRASGEHTGRYNTPLWTP
jgi:molybdenum cofactor cytidylyltransferase